MSNSLFKGTGVAIITPFHKDGSIDFKSLQNIIDFQISGHINYLVVMGTTGESATLTKDEKNAIINFVIEIVDNRIPIVLGIGGNNTQDVINNINSQSFDGISGLLSVCPFYNKPQQKGLYMHYKAIATHSPVPVILYNVPGRTGVNLKAETVIKLATEFKNIIAVKEASGNLDQMMQIIKHKPKDFLVISGDDALALPQIALGADGVISVTANAFPMEYSEMIQLCLKGNFKKACETQYKLVDIIETLFTEGSPAGVKAALEIKKLCSNNLRLPLTPISKPTYNNLATLMEDLKN
ncbi:MAG: 4-hydroxy-tetrahydrodipicolinate synthase [Bacteroidetes bacterium]|nr:4-hydroxy-tetrahydrodipicolinate synthase [Bacteroidota bacterium]